MAYNCIGGDCIVCAVMDARCSQVYNALFHVKGASVERLCDDRALALSDLKEELLRIDGNIVLVGDGASLSYAYLKDVVPNISSDEQPHSDSLVDRFGSVRELEQGRDPDSRRADACLSQTAAGSA